MAQSASRAAARARPARDRSTVYEEITNKIIGELEAGRLPWVQPWGSSTIRASLGMPKNAATGRAYSGINVLILWNAVVERGFTVQSWLTFKQAQALGGHVRAAERGTTIVYADRFIPDDMRDRAHERGEEPRGIPFLKRFTVFNADQCESLPGDVTAGPAPIDASLILPQVKELLHATAADVRIGGDKAYYDVAGDFIRVPPPRAFFEPINFGRTLTHELSHWSGASHRLSRDLSGALGSKPYYREELCAEISSAYICATLGIVPTVRHADYAGAWIDLMGEDSGAIVRAASAASKAADYLLAFRDRQAGAAARENGHRTLPEACGPTCCRRFRPRGPLSGTRRVPEEEEGRGAS
ncbi:MAG TPA: zincin-like metallopeptidase domain-containing protein [Hyphomicrobiaceae bacterium]